MRFPYLFVSRSFTHVADATNYLCSIYPHPTAPCQLVRLTSAAPYQTRCSGDLDLAKLYPTRVRVSALQVEVAGCHTVGFPPLSGSHIVISRHQLGTNAVEMPGSHSYTPYEAKMGQGRRFESIEEQPNAAFVRLEVKNHF